MSLLTRRPAAESVPVEPVPVDPFADLPRGPYVTPDGPTLAVLLDQDPRNAFRVHPDAIRDVLPVIADQHQAFLAAREAETQNHGHARAPMRVPHSVRVGHDAARRRVGLPSLARGLYGDEQIEWPADVPASWHAWAYEWFAREVARAEKVADERRLVAKIAAGVRHQHRCRVCGAEGAGVLGERDPRRSTADVVYPGQVVWMCAPCRDAVRALMAERALVARTPDGRPVRDLAAAWLDAG